MTGVHLRQDLDALGSYRPGAAPDDGGDGAYKLSSNENPYPPLPSVASRVTELIVSANRYPDLAAHGITMRLSERFNVPPVQVVVGAGSVEIISQLMRATSGTGDEIVFAWRSYEAYPLLAVAAGARPVQVPLAPGFRHDFPAMRAAITPRTRLIIVCNPNNPTSTTASTDELDEFVRSVPPHIVILIDEAYWQLNREPDTARGVDFLHRYPNIVVAHTFSKAYGLAGLRIGYALAAEPVATAMRKVALPFSVTNLAQAAAIASLDAEDELAVRVETLLSERDRVGNGLEELGLNVPASQANFFWLPLGERTEEAVACLARHRVLVRPFIGEGLRLSLGNRAANDAVLAAAAELAGAAG